jgi:hypothetical protein
MILGLALKPREIDVALMTYKVNIMACCTSMGQSFVERFNSYGCLHNAHGESIFSNLLLLAAEQNTRMSHAACVPVKFVQAV